MAVSSYKQPCPSCEAMVSIKDASLVGKKIDCPKCKYRFQVEKPKQAKANGQTKRFRDQEKAEEEVAEVEELEEAEVEEVDEEPVRKSKPPQAKGRETPAKKDAGKAKPQVKKAPVEEEPEEEEEPRKKKPAKPLSRAKVEAAAEVDEADDDEEESEGDEDEGKKKKKGSNKLVLGLVLAGVGVAVLGLAGFLMLGMGGGSSAKTLSRPNLPRADPIAATPVPGPKEPEQSIPVKLEAKDVPAPVSPTNEIELAANTNLLPGDTEHVFHVFFKDLFAANSPIRNASFAGDDVLDDAELKKKIGFSVLAIDDLIRAEKYTGQPWTFTILHLREPVSEVALKTALQLKPSTPIKKQAYYQMTEANPWFDQLAHLALGVPAQVRQLVSRPAKQPSFVRLHGPQTLIIADEVPMQAFLQVEGSFPIQANKPPPDPNAPPPPLIAEGSVWEGTESLEGFGKLRLEFNAGDQLKMSDAKDTVMGTWRLDGTNVTLEVAERGSYTGMVAGTSLSGDAKDKDDKLKWTWKVAKNPAARAGMIGGPDLRSEMYLTLKPELKTLLDKMETASPEQKLLYSSATNMDAARIKGVNLPEFKDHIPRRPRQMWDISLLVTEHRPLLHLLGTALVQRQGRTLQYRNELVCAQEQNAKELNHDLIERVTPQIARFMDKLLALKIDLPKLGTPADPTAPPPAPMPMTVPGLTAAVKTPEPTTSQMKTEVSGATVEFSLDLVLDQSAAGRLFNLTAMAAGALRSEMDLTGIVPARHALARAGQQLGARGLSSAGVPPGNWPSGAFPRPAGSRLDREPLSRVSWMAGLLPFLGHEALFSRIDLKDSWRDPSNWLAARTLVPQFLDPTYPDAARYTTSPGLPVDLGATHFVGIAGVGLDAATYRPGDPATLHKRGVMGYEQSLSVAEVQKGRGAANTILMIQVPHDGVAGVTAWIAGGGSTLRGVPEKNSIAPFVLSKDRTNQIIRHQGKRGTFALMTDGSVRFIDQTVSDDVFKAMCTVTGPAPEKFNLDRDGSTPLVPDPNAKTLKSAGKAAPPAPKKTAVPPVEKKPNAEEKKAPAENKKAASSGSRNRGEQRAARRPPLLGKMEGT
jgi:hypothetical protein